MSCYAHSKGLGMRRAGHHLPKFPRSCEAQGLCPKLILFLSLIQRERFQTKCGFRVGQCPNNAQRMPVTLKQKQEKKGNCRKIAMPLSHLAAAVSLGQTGILFAHSQSPNRTTSTNHDKVTNQILVLTQTCLHRRGKRKRNTSMTKKKKRQNWEGTNQSPGMET